MFFFFYVLDASVLMKRISVCALEKMYLWVHTYITAVKIRQRMTSKARQPKIWIILVKKHDKQTYLNDKCLLKQPWSWWLSPSLLSHHWTKWIFRFSKKHFDTLFKYYVNYYTRVHKSITKNMSQYHKLYILNNFMRPV